MPKPEALAASSRWLSDLSFVALAKKEATPPVFIKKKIASRRDASPVIRSWIVGFQARLASLRDAHNAKSFPVVSLRSTTGYWL